MSAPPTISDIALETINPETGKPPETRIKDAATGRQMFQVMAQQDQARALQRTRHQAILDGEPPYDADVLRSKGRQQTNVNWNDCRDVADTIEAGLMDMDASTEVLVKVPLMQGAVPDDELKFQYETILSEEVSTTIRDWQEYTTQNLNLGIKCFWHGVGIAYFEDHIDWRFESTMLGDFVIPNGTKASESRIPVAACLRWMELHDVWAYIKDEEVATNLGWNVQAVKQAILDATPEFKGTGWSQNNWMQIQERLRGNDLGWSVAGRTAKVGLVHEWCREFDGTISKYITTVNPPGGSSGQGPEPWLYYKKSAYQEMRQAMVFFTYSIGEHGTYHSIGGMGRRIFPQANALNRAMCTMLDAAVAGSGIFMQPTTESSMQKMTLVPIGGGLTLLPAKDHGEMVLRPVPDLSHGIQPIISDFRSTLGKRAGQFQSTDSPFNQATEKTRFEVATQLEQLNKVGSTQAHLWYAPRTRLFREMTRRMCNPDYAPQMPGGEEVAEFHARLMERGFPLELLRAIDFKKIRAERAIGAGSGASRIGRLTQLNEMKGELSETGRYRLNRDIVASILDGDYTAADRYIPREPQPLPPIDAQFATMENKMVDLGMEPELIEGQMPIVHLQIHMPKLIEMVQAANQSEEAMVELAEKMLILHQHCVDTLETVQDAPSIEPMVADYRQQLQQLGGIVDNAVRKAIAMQRKEAEESAEAGQGGEAISEGQLKMLDRAAESQVKLENMRNESNQRMRIQEETHQQKMSQKEQEFRQKAALDDAKTAGQIMTDARKQAIVQQHETVIHRLKQETAEKTARLKEESARKVISMKAQQPKAPRKSGKK